MASIHWLDVVLAPLTWLERTRGRRRLALVGLYATVLVVVGSVVGREAILWRLPDAPEPFDLAKYGHVDLADADNAMRYYAQAGQAIAPGTPRGNALPGSLNPAQVELNHAALQLWLHGTERPDALMHQPDRPANPQLWIRIDDLTVLSRLAEFEATRRQAAGDLAGAWVYDRAAIRSALHLGRHAGADAVHGGLTILQSAIPRALAWVDDPLVTPELLHGAIADIQGSRSLQSSATDVARIDYLTARANLLDPDQTENWEFGRIDRRLWLNHLPALAWTRRYLWNEPKRSFKVLRLVVTGQLAQCERPVGERSPLFAPDRLVYQIDSSTPPILRRIRPQELVDWVNASYCRPIVQHLSYCQRLTRDVESLLDQLRMRLAERAYALDHEGRPASTFGELLGLYLDQLPPGVVAADRLSAP